MVMLGAGLGQCGNREMGCGDVGCWFGSMWQKGDGLW